MTDDQIPEADKAFVTLGNCGFETVLLFRNELGSVAAVALDGDEEAAVLQAIESMDDLDARITDHATVTEALRMLSAKLRDGGVAWSQMVAKIMEAPPMNVTRTVNSVANMAREGRVQE
jgi:hypothetical protein